MIDIRSESPMDERFVDGYGGTEEQEEFLRVSNNNYTDEPALTSSGEEILDTNRPPSRKETIERFAKSPATRRQRPEDRFSPPRQSATTRKRQTIPKRVPAQPAKKKKNSLFTTFYIAILCIGIAVCLTLLIIILQSFDGTDLIARDTPTEPPRQPIIVDVPELRSFTGLITDINHFSQPRTLYILDISSGRTVRYYVTDTSVLTKAAIPPASMIFWVCFLPSSSLMSAITTLPPARANSSAVAAPIPIAPPVIMHTFPFN